MSLLHKSLLGFALAATLAGCGSSGGSDQAGDGAQATQNHQNFFAAKEDDTTYPIKSYCGAMVDEELQQPIPLEKLEQVLVQPLTPDRAIITRTVGEFAGLPQIIKLHGVTANPEPNAYALGMQLMTAGSSPYAYFISAGNNCIVQTEDGGLAQLGQLISPDGYSFSEVERFYNTAIPTSEICGGEFLAQCFNQIPVGGVETEPSPYEIEVYLWKPASDSDGNLVVLTDVYDVTVIVGGETGLGIGPSNGYGTTAKFSKPGCAYGSALVEFRDSNGRRIYTKDGQASLTGAGCSRDKREFK